MSPELHLLLLDSAPSADAVTVAGQPVAVAAPDRLRHLLDTPQPVRIVANLASRDVLEALTALRAAGCTAPVWGCLADLASGRGLPLGRVEPSVRPLDAEDVLGALAPHAPRGTRVVTVGADVDALVGLRYTLTHHGLSVGMAWDARQAEEVLALVQPQAAVLDLGMPDGAGYAILARLAGRDAPAMVLVPGEEDPAPGLRAALAAPANAARAVSLASILGRLLPPAERASACAAG